MPDSARVNQPDRGLGERRGDEKRGDRKSVGEGKRVDLGGRRHIKKKKKLTTCPGIPSAMWT